MVNNEMKKMNSKGFTVVHGLLMLVIIAIIGGSGFFVYKAQEDTNGSLDNTAHGSDSSIDIPKKEKSDALDNPAQKYLEIPQWGVKVPLSDSLKDLEYKVLGNTNAFGEKQPQIKFYTKETNDLGLVCDSNYKILTMNRGRAIDVPVLGDGPGPENTTENTYKYLFDNKASGLFSIHHGDYYYVPTGGGEDCVHNQSADTIAKTNETLEVIKQALAKMTSL